MNAPFQSQCKGDEINCEVPKSNEKVSIRRAKRCIWIIRRVFIPPLPHWRRWLRPRLGIGLPCLFICACVSAVLEQRGPADAAVLSIHHAGPPLRLVYGCVRVSVDSTDWTTFGWVLARRTGLRSGECWLDGLDYARVSVDSTGWTTFGWVLTRRTGLRSGECWLDGLDYVRVSVDSTDWTTFGWVLTRRAGLRSGECWLDGLDCVRLSVQCPLGCPPPKKNAFFGRASRKAKFGDPGCN